MRRFWPALLLLGAGCAPDAEVLPPLGEAVVVVDTDAPVPLLVSKLRVDLYEVDGTWIRTLEVPRSSAEGWPLSFSVFTPDETQGRDLLLRLRAYPDNKVRDYRGERFVPVPAPNDYPDQCPGASPEYTENKRLLRRDEAGALELDDAGEPIDITPLEEPLPDLTIDRLLQVRLEPGVAGGLRVTLHGACFGSEANLFDMETCVDAPQVYVPVQPRVGTDDPNLGSSLAGSWPPPAPCEAPTADDEVCVDGGAYILGDLGVFGFGRFDAFPERVAVVPALRVARYEVTVAAFRAWWTAEMRELPSPSAPEDDDAVSSFCTWSETDGVRDGLPLNCVPWVTARAYCVDRGGDLPTEAQWEWVAAAAGRTQQDRYPFGSDLAACGLGVHARAEGPASGATECNALGFGPQAASEPRGDITPIYGIASMGGNLREWVLDEYRAYCSSGWAATSWDNPLCIDTGTQRRTARGGDWTVSSELMLSAIRELDLGPEDRSDRVGFRCVRPGALPEGG